MVVALAALVLNAAAPAAGGPLDAAPRCGVEGSGRRAAARPDLRVATFNILHTLEDAADKTFPTRLRLLADALHASGADVIGAQEVIQSSTYGNAAQRLARELAARSGQRWEWCWFQSNPHFPGEPDVQDGGGGGPITEVMVSAAHPPEPEFREGVAILTRLHIRDALARRLPPRSYEAAACVPPDPLDCNAAAFFDSRQVLWARVDTGRQAFDMFTSHIAHDLTPLSDTTKLIHVRAALAAIDEFATSDETPDFFVGDFNSTPDTDRHAAVVADGFVDTFAARHPGGGGFTSDQAVVTRSPKPTTTERIDYVFARPGRCGLRVHDSHVIGTNAERQRDGQWVWPSDHLGVVSALECGHPIA